MLHVNRTESLPNFEFAKANTDKLGTIETNKQMKRIHKIIEEDAKPNTKQEKEYVINKIESGMTEINKEYIESYSKPYQTTFGENKILAESPENCIIEENTRSGIKYIRSYRDYSKDGKNPMVYQDQRHLKLTSNMRQPRRIIESGNRLSQSYKSLKRRRRKKKRPEFDLSLQTNSNFNNSRSK